MAEHAGAARRHGGLFVGREEKEDKRKMYEKERERERERLGGRSDRKKSSSDKKE